MLCKVNLPQNIASVDGITISCIHSPMLVRVDSRWNKVSDSSLLPARQRNGSTATLELVELQVDQLQSPQQFKVRSRTIT